MHLKNELDILHLEIDFSRRIMIGLFILLTSSIFIFSPEHSFFNFISSWVTLLLGIFWLAYTIILYCKIRKEINRKYFRKEK